MFNKIRSLVMPLVLLGVVGTFSATNMAQAETLRIGTEGTYRPWTMVDAFGRVSGFDADLAEKICQKIDAKCHFVVQNFNSLIPALSRGRFNLIFSSLSISNARAKKIDFSVPYAQMKNVFVVRKDSPLAKISDKQDLFKALSGKKVGVQNATTHAAYAEKHLSDANIRSYDTFDELLMDLKNGRLDAAFADTAIWSAYMAEPANQKQFSYVDVVIPMSDDPATLGGGVGVGFPKGKNTELRQRVNQAICELEADGTVKAISEKWFNGADVSIPCQEDKNASKSVADIKANAEQAASEKDMHQQ